MGTSSDIKLFPLKYSGVFFTPKQWRQFVSIHDTEIYEILPELADIKPCEMGSPHSSRGDIDSCYHCNPNNVN